MNLNECDLLGNVLMDYSNDLLDRVKAGGRPAVRTRASFASSLFDTERKIRKISHLFGRTCPDAQNTDLYTRNMNSVATTIFEMGARENY